MPFESPAIVELMGHAKIAGKVSEQVIAGVAMLRVDVPKTSKREGYTKFYAPGAIYCLTPTDEATANRAAEAFDIEPISPWILRLPESPALAEKVALDEDEYYAYMNEDDYDTEDDDPDDGYPDDDEDEYPEDDEEDGAFAADLRAESAAAQRANEAEQRVAIAELSSAELEASEKDATTTEDSSGEKT